jgi:amidase
LDICQQPATELARLIRGKALSSREVVFAFLSRIQTINPRVNAIVTLVADAAMDAARAADERVARGHAAGPLHGLPIVHKDLQTTAGIRTTFGSPIFKNHIPTEDSPLVRRLKAAGAVTIGKTNTPEFGAGSQTFNPVFGATLNPYDTTKTCGGSSGGAAVALACRMVPIADGTDMGGSLRNPAAFCGVVGMRPSASLVGGDTSTGWSALSVDGPMARTASDLALLLDAIRVGPIGPGPALGARDFKGVRIAWSTDFGGLPFDKGIREAVDSQRAAFEVAGCCVEGADADFTGADEIFKTLRAKAFVEKHAPTVRDHRGLVKDTILWEIARGERLAAADVDAAERARIELRQRISRFMERFEFIVLPTTQAGPFNVEEPFVTSIDGVQMESYIDWMKSCYFISAVGYPAISVPCGFTPDGLPVGLQIVGREGADWSVLQLADTYEQVRGEFPAPNL